METRGKPRTARLKKEQCSGSPAKITGEGGDVQELNRRREEDRAEAAAKGCRLKPRAKKGLVDQQKGT